MDLTIYKPDDFHVHLRGSLDTEHKNYEEQNALLKISTPITSKIFGRVLAMPNTKPPIETIEQAKDYFNLINAYSQSDNFHPMLAIYLTEKTSPDAVCGFENYYDVPAFKLYPQEIKNTIKHFYPIFEVIRDCNKVLCLHGEAVNTSHMLSELKFLPLLKQLTMDFPKLRIVLEHVSTKEGVDLVKELPSNVVATITPHHLCTELDSILEGIVYLCDTIKTRRLNPHHFCIPIPKTSKDRHALIDIATSGHPKFFLGSDSAPHARTQKESASSPPGVYTAPIIMSLLAEIFDEHRALNKLEAFSSINGANFYNLPINKDKITLVKNTFNVPQTYKSKDNNIEVVPFLAGKTINWSVV